MILAVVLVISAADQTVLVNFSVVCRTVSNWEQAPAHDTIWWSVSDACYYTPRPSMCTCARGDQWQLRLYALRANDVILLGIIDESLPVSQLRLFQSTPPWWSRTHHNAKAKKAILMSDLMHKGPFYRVFYQSAETQRQITGE
jgi:hypothetical protein